MGLTYQDSLYLSRFDILKDHDSMAVPVLYPASIVELVFGDTARIYQVG
jgi:hypothetical protein